MGAGQTVLAAAHMQKALPQINLLAPQSDQFRHAKSVPISVAARNRNVAATFLCRRRLLYGKSGHDKRCSMPRREHHYQNGSHIRAGEQNR
jgi:hypothetical protein